MCGLLRGLKTTAGKSERAASDKLNEAGFVCFIRYSDEHNRHKVDVGRKGGCVCADFLVKV